MRGFLRRAGSRIKGVWPVLATGLFIAAFAISACGARTLEQNEAISAARRHIIRAAVSCYGIEGAYPPSYDYLKEHYPVYINEQKYAVFYTVFASNIMPDVSVIRR